MLSFKLTFSSSLSFHQRAFSSSTQKPYKPDTCFVVVVFLLYHFSLLFPWLVFPEVIFRILLTNQTYVSVGTHTVKSFIAITLIKCVMRMPSEVFNLNIQEKSLSFSVFENLIILHKYFAL